LKQVGHVKNSNAKEQEKENKKRRPHRVALRSKRGKRMGTPLSFNDQFHPPLDGTGQMTFIGLATYYASCVPAFQIQIQVFLQLTIAI
jgi:hypothetical protein